MDGQLLLSVRDLRTEFHTGKDIVSAVNGVSFDLLPGERMAIVGESGSGKSALAMSLIRLISYPGQIAAGSVQLEGKDLLSVSEGEMNRIRGARVGTVFQDPMASLDPVMRIEDQMIIPIRKHLRLSDSQAKKRVIELLEQVGIPDPAARMKSYPFELSGGMRQRVMIAMALSCKPKLIIADEPTTALDVTIQAQIVELLRDLTETTRTAMLFISHDMGLVARIAHKVAVMYAGKIVEIGDVRDLFERPRHPYTQSLLKTIPNMAGPPARRLLQIEGFPPDLRSKPVGCSFKDRCSAAVSLCYEKSPELTVREEGHLASCWKEWGLSGREIVLPKTADAVIAAETRPEADSPADAMPGNGAAGDVVLRVKGLRKTFSKSSLLPWKPAVNVHALNGVELTLKAGETLGIVGESGCGKSTLARLLMHLDSPTDGTVEINGKRLSELKGDELRQARNKVQMVFQDPYSSFNPKMRIGDIISEPLDVQEIGTKEERRRTVNELLGKVGLETSYANRYPSQLSGGQRQRVGIARALALNPSIIVADEPTSALDVSIRAQVINLLCDLKEDLGLSFIFISHDLSTVHHISDKIIVMYLGRIVEQGIAKEVFKNPKHPYTKALLAAVPIPDPVLEGQREFSLLTGDLPSPSNLPKGCAFNSRCPVAKPQCFEQRPELNPYSTDRLVACHYAS